MSTSLITYLNYIITWKDASDDDITSLITEQETFVSLGAFDAQDAVNSEFDDLISEADVVRDLTIAEDAVQMLADVAAIASIWTFGLGMATFIGMEAEAWAIGKDISNKSADLNKKLGTIDNDIAAKISPKVNSYITQYKANNNLIASLSPVGLDTKECRSYLMQFMAQVQRNSPDKKTLDIAGFKTWIESADRLYNSPEINQVYAALDDLNFSAKTTADAEKCLVAIDGLNLPETEMKAIQAIGVFVMVRKLGVAEAQIREAAANLDPEATRDTWEVRETEPSAFKMMDAWGKFAAGIVIVMSVVDIFLNIYSIVDVVEQCQAICEKLSGPIKQSYGEFFDSIQEASTKYNEAIAEGARALPPPTPKA